jgi:hypothetical protein
VNQRHVSKVCLADLHFGAQYFDAIAHNSRDLRVFFWHTPCLQAAGVLHYSS